MLAYPTRQVTQLSCFCLANYGPGTRFGFANGKFFSQSALNYLPKNSQNGLERYHSEILGFTSDMIMLEKEELVIVSSVNVSTAGSGPSQIKDYLNDYMEKIILPVAKKYAK